PKLVEKEVSFLEKTQQERPAQLAQCASLGVDAPDLGLRRDRIERASRLRGHGVQIRQSVEEAAILPPPPPRTLSSRAHGSRRGAIPFVAIHRLPRCRTQYTREHKARGLPAPAGGTCY